MLPFYLRESDKKGAKRQRCQSGGPVQRAITNDLINLRTKFREQLLLDRGKHDATSPNHWKPGTAFAIFKDVFESSKIAMIHLLSPARCDREGYSQLIYAACLALFKDSFGKMQRPKVDQSSVGETECNKDRENHYKDSVFAIFALLALFETNPLPRGVSGENPLELLPISLQLLSGGPRSSHRRYFSKNIRIDRQHFALMIRLKELALAKRSNCERLFYELQRLDPKESKSQPQQGFSSDCSCEISIDAIEVLERIFPCLELCEYTGPVGVEAFAGHAEYPHNGSSISCQKSDGQKNMTTRQYMHSRLAEENDNYHIESSNGQLNEISSFLQKYRKSVAAIRISKSNGVKRLKTALEPLFSQINNMKFDDSREGEETERDDGREEQYQFKEYHESESSRHSNTLPNFKLVLSSDINTGLEKALHASTRALFARDELLSPLSGMANGMPKSSIDTDDVSSIGHGGISTGTPFKVAVTENLAVGKFRLPNHKKSDNEIVKQSFANKFLTSKQSVNTADSSEEDSVDSEITIESFSDSEGMEEDVETVATSTFGKKALEDLLQNVAEGDVNFDRNKSRKRTQNKKKQSVKKNTKQQRKKIDGIEASFLGTKDDEDDEKISVATSAFGKRALEDLFKHVVREDMVLDESEKKKLKSKPKTTKNKKMQKAGTGRSHLDSKDRVHNEETSVATSTFGKRALEDLLHKAEKQERPKSQNRKSKEKNTKIQTHSENEETSVATSTFGKRALEDLLHKAEKQEKPKSQNRKSKEKNTKIQTHSENEETSVATSTFGKRALEDLLHKAEKQERPKKQNRKSTEKDTKMQTHTENEEGSVATSTFGKRALEDLLQTAEK